MRGSPSTSASRIGALLLFCCLIAPAARAQSYPDMALDVKNIMGWLSHEMAQGLAFNAGSSFDPPEEVKGYRLQPDTSLGVGMMPLDKKKFPTLSTPALNDYGASGIFPSQVLFPNMTLHLRAGLPLRSDFAIRLTNMTTPPNYKIANNTSGKGQSNTVGFAVRRHFFGGGKPLLGIGANYNHVFGHFQYKTALNLAVPNFSTTMDVDGDIQWAVNSFGLNAVVSQSFGKWTPFFGFGYNYATGSVRSRLQIVAHTFLISPIIGEASQHPESSQGRLILGTQVNTSWLHLFANGEIKAIGVHAGQSWIVHTGVMLPFRIGSRRLAAKESSTRPSAPRLFPARQAAPEESFSDLIFIQ